MVAFSPMNAFGTAHRPVEGTPRQILSVTGGGLLGVIPAAMLVRLEELGRAAHGAEYRLCHSFDLVGGASTGAVIATGVALGLPAREIASFYLDEAPIGFRRRRFSIPLLQDKLDHASLQSHFAGRTRGRRLARGDLHCDLTILTKSLSRAIPMAFSTLATAQAGTLCLGAELRADRLPLDRLLRASTAAPGLFRPEMLPTGADGAPEICIDGGLSPFNNSALLLTRLAQSVWPDDLAVTTLGTGLPRTRRAVGPYQIESAVTRLMKGFTSMVGDMCHHVDDIMNALAEMPGGGLAHRRYDMDLTASVFSELGVDVSRAELRQMRAFADIRGKARLFDIALRHANRIVEIAPPLTARGRSELGVPACARAA
ncbi:MAG: patatin-like phospholipase family protein [Pseudomonadota bacterium]